MRPALPVLANCDGLLAIGTSNRCKLCVVAAPDSYARKVVAFYTVKVFEIRRVHLGNDANLRCGNACAPLRYVPLDNATNRMRRRFGEKMDTSSVIALY